MSTPSSHLPARSRSSSPARALRSRPHDCAHDTESNTLQLGMFRSLILPFYQQSTGSSAMDQRDKAVLAREGRRLDADATSCKCRTTAGDKKHTSDFTHPGCSIRAVLTRTLFRPRSYTHGLSCRRVVYHPINLNLASIRPTCHPPLRLRPPRNR